MLHHLLYTTITLDGLWDILEGQAVHESWLDAAWFNAEEAREG